MKTKAILNPDTNNTNPAYWERVLRSHGLPVAREEIIEVSETSWADEDSLDFVEHGQQ